MLKRCELEKESDNVGGGEWERESDRNSDVKNELERQTVRTITEINRQWGKWEREFGKLMRDRQWENEWETDSGKMNERQRESERERQRKMNKRQLRGKSERQWENERQRGKWWERLGKMRETERLMREWGKWMRDRQWGKWMRGADSVKNERQSGENEREEREIIKNTKWREREKSF